MISGAFVAAFRDLTFDLYGYCIVFLNDVLTALSGLYLKKASNSCSKNAILFYNSYFSMWLMILYLVMEELFCNYRYLIQETEMYHSITGVEANGGNGSSRLIPEKESEIMAIIHFDGWQKWDFVVLFIGASMGGSLLNYSIFLCTLNNSALTTAVVGCLKNVLVTYCGMFLVVGYIFDWLNFTGLNISIIGSLYYTYVTLIIARQTGEKFLSV